jgi:DNA processing protein
VNDPSAEYDRTPLEPGWPPQQATSDGIAPDALPDCFLPEGAGREPGGPRELTGSGPAGVPGGSPRAQGESPAAYRAVTWEERFARAALTYAARPGDRVVVPLARSLGAVRALEVIRCASLAAVTALPATPQARHELERLRARLAFAPRPEAIGYWLDAGMRLVCPGDAEWPCGLDALGDEAPVALWVTGVGHLGFSCRRSVTVTGSRAATAYGSYLAAEISASLAGQGLTVIAGGSFGVEASAHRGALGADGVTVAVTAGGLDRPYPAAHADLFNAITAQGALVSEAPPETPVLRVRFKARARILAALACGTVVAEAARHSSALTVALHARDLGRPVMAIPGPVTSDLSAGCNELIRSGHAALVTSARDVAGTLTAAGRLTD